MQERVHIFPGVRTFYRPIEAAIRWCGLLRFEARVLKVMGARPVPHPQEFRRWPLLRLHTERIFDALVHLELPYGKAGIVRRSHRPALDDPDLTVRHVDLKTWMSRYYPAEKPAFLFDDVERAIHPAVTIDALNVLLADRDAAKLRVDDLLRALERMTAQHQLATKKSFEQVAELTQLLESLRTKHDALLMENAKRVAEAERTQIPSQRSESTYLNIIGGLVTLLLGKSPGGKPYSVFRTLDSVVSTLAAHREGRRGLSERTLWSKLVEARRHLEGSR